MSPSAIPLATDSTRRWGEAGHYGWVTLKCTKRLAARPQLLLLDEPFSSLDPLLREELMSEVRRLADELQAALVLVTHAPLEALTLSRRALVLEDGRVAEAGELDSLLVAPQSRLLLRFATQMKQTRAVYSHQLESRAQYQPAP